MLRGIKIRLYPNKNQEVVLNQHLGSYRYVYNNLLSLKSNTYNETKENLGLTELSKHFHNVMLKNEETPWLKEQNTKVMKQAIRQLMTAYTNFFTHKRGFPKFKSKKDNKQSCLFSLEAISKRNTFETKHITLIKSLKNVKFRCSDLYHRRLRDYKDNIKSATLTRTKSGNYFLSVLVDIPEHELVKFKNTNRNVGVDVGVKDFLVTSDGEVFPNKRFTSSNDKKLKKLHRELSRKQNGSKNKDKARIRLARFSEKIVNQKGAYLHSVVNSLLSDYDIIFMEDLNVKGMMANHKLARSVQELSLFRFKGICKYKSVLNNKMVVEIDRWFPSSKLCNVCGFKNKFLSLSDRSWVCPECRTEHNRDLNAALNILSEGEKIIGSDASNLTVGHRMPEFTLVEIGSVDDPCDSNVTLLKSTQSLKQEIEMNEKIGNTNFL